MSVRRELAPSRKRVDRSQRSPSSSFIRIIQSSACLAARMPPAGLKPTAASVRVSYSRIMRAMTTPTGSTALMGSLPVDVLMKSAPAIIATMLARATLVSVASSPVPRIAFMCARPQASRNARTSAYKAGQSPVRTCARVMTMSISCAPAATEACTSSSRCAKGFRPAGNPVETAATGIPEPARAATAVGTRAWYTHTAPTLMSRWATPSDSTRSGRSGRRALAQSRSTFPGVSSPCSVVRSMHVIARSSHAACHSFFTVRRVGMVAARRSTALRLTRSARMTSRSSGMPGLRSSVTTGRTTPTARSRSEVIFMMAGECEPPLEKSTRRGDSRAQTACGFCLRLLGAQALLFSLGQAGEQRRDFLAQRLVARRPAGFVPDDAAELERRIRGRRPIHERFGRAKVAGGAIGIARLVAQVRRLLRIPRGVGRDVATKALETDRALARRRALARLGGVAHVAVIQIQHDGCLHLIAGMQIPLGHDGARIQRIRRIERLECRGAHVVMAVRSEHRGRMMRGGRVDHALHERAAVARLAVPPVGEQVVAVQHRQPVPHPVHALEEHPAARGGALKRLAQRFDFRLRHLIARFEI